MLRRDFFFSFFLFIYFTNYFKLTDIWNGGHCGGPSGRWVILAQHVLNLWMFYDLFHCIKIYFFLNASSKPGGGQRGRAEAEVWAARQWGDRNPPEGCSQLHDRPWQGAGYQPHIQPSTTHSTFFMHTFERSPLPTCLFFLNPSCTVTVFTGHSLLTLPSLSGSHIRGAFVFSLFILSPTHFFFSFFAPFFCQRLIFLRERHSRSDV